MSRISNSNGVRTPAGPALLLAPCLLLAGGVLATAQDALRLSEPDGRSADAGRQAIADLTVADGSVRRWSAVSSMALGYSDNLSLAPAGGAIADGFVEPSQLLSYDWPLTERQRISLGATVTYRRHFSHSEHDRFTVAPGSQLRFVGRVGNVGLRSATVLS